MADLYSRNNGLDVIGNMLEFIPRDKIIILTTADNRHLSYYESYCGITNFVFADDSLEEIRRAFLSAFAGRCYCDLKNSSALTARECEILKLIASGKTSKEIADELCISKNTVDTHRNKMLQKLDITNSASLVQFAYRTGLL
ncbi:MAG: response regulator transcription factor [Deferribacterales bacterium]